MDRQTMLRTLALGFLLALPGAVALAHGQEHAAPAAGFSRPIKRAAGDATAMSSLRLELLRNGETALAASDAATAIDAFERAGNIKHAADAEVGLVRAYMQAGHYRQALAFVAHTAGAHLDDAGGQALYAWLLHIGGQGAAAQLILSGAEQRLPGNPLLALVRRQLQSSHPDAALLPQADSPRFQPYGASGQLPGSAAMAGSGILIGDGQFVLAPLTTVRDMSGIWVRNGLGQLRKAQVERRFAADRLALLKLDAPLPAAADAAPAERDPFPGSVAYAVEYVVSSQVQPAWPLLTAGFLGSTIGMGPDRKLGIELPAGPRGSGVFDAGGHLAGIAVAGGTEPDVLIPISMLREYLGDALGLASPMPAKSPASADAVYEASMRMTLQILVMR